VDEYENWKHNTNEENDKYKDMEDAKKGMSKR